MENDRSWETRCGHPVRDDGTWKWTSGGGGPIGQYTTGRVGRIVMPWMAEEQGMQHSTGTGGTWFSSPGLYLENFQTIRRVEIIFP